MKTIFTTCSILLSLCFTDLKSQTALPYYTGFDTPTEKVGWQLFRKGAADPSYTWSYVNSMAYSAPYYLDHLYPVGGTTTTDDWFVSPGFNLPAGGKLDSIRSAFSGFGIPGVSDTIAVYLLKGSADPALATSKTLLLDYRGTSYVNDGTWRRNSAINIAPGSGSCYVAIRYKTVNNWLDVKFDNLKISSSSVSGTKEATSQKEQITIYPNPAAHQLNVSFNQETLDAALTLKIYNALGQLQLSQPIKHKQPIPLTLTNGTYFYTIETVDQLYQTSGKLLIQNN